LARGLMKRWDKKIIKLVDEQRLLIITPFGKSITRITSETAMQRNKLIAEISDELFIPHSNKDGIIDKIKKEFTHKIKAVK